MWTDAVDGDRIGYVVKDSVELPELPALTPSPHLMRAECSLCDLYRQRTPHTVDVFMTATGAPRGNVIGSVAGSLMSCTQDKRLAWRVAHRPATAAASHPQAAAMSRCCAVCVCQSVGCVHVGRRVSDLPPRMLQQTARADDLRQSSRGAHINPPSACCAPF